MAGSGQFNAAGRLSVTARRAAASSRRTTAVVTRIDNIAAARPQDLRRLFDAVGALAARSTTPEGTR